MGFMPADRDKTAVKAGGSIEPSPVGCSPVKERCAGLMHWPLPLPGSGVPCGIGRSGSRPGLSLPMTDTYGQNPLHSRTLPNVSLLSRCRDVM